MLGKCVRVAKQQEAFGRYPFVVRGIHTACASTGAHRKTTGRWGTAIEFLLLLRNTDTFSE